MANTRMFKQIGIFVTIVFISAYPVAAKLTNEQTSNTIWSGASYLADRNALFESSSTTKLICARKKHEILWEMLQNLKGLTAEDQPNVSYQNAHVDLLDRRLAVSGEDCFVRFCQSPNRTKAGSLLCKYCEECCSGGLKINWSNASASCSLSTKLYQWLYSPLNVSFNHKNGNKAVFVMKQGNCSNWFRAKENELRNNLNPITIDFVNADDEDCERNEVCCLVVHKAALFCSEEGIVASLYINVEREAVDLVKLKELLANMTKVAVTEIQLAAGPKNNTLVLLLLPPQAGMELLSIVSSSEKKPVFLNALSSAISWQADYVTVLAKISSLPPIKMLFVPKEPTSRSEEHKPCAKAVENDSASFVKVVMLLTIVLVAVLICTRMNKTERDNHKALLKVANQRVKSVQRDLDTSKRESKVLQQLLNDREEQQERNAQQIANLQLSLTDKEALLQVANQRVKSVQGDLYTSKRERKRLQLLLNDREDQQERNAQQIASLQLFLADKEASLQEATQRVKHLQSDLKSKQREVLALQQQMNDREQDQERRIVTLQVTLTKKEALIQEANIRGETLQSDLEREHRRSEGLQQQVENLQFLQKRADQINAELRQRIQPVRERKMRRSLSVGIVSKPEEGSHGVRQSQMLNIASKDIHLTDRKLGHGSYGEVRIGNWRGCPVAVKMLYESLAEHQRNLELLLQEASVAWKMHHPNVAAVLGVTLEESDKKVTAWIIMELLQGSMSSVIEASQRQKAGTLTLRERVDMARDSLCGLDYLHCLSVLHGDVRPTNILVTAVMGAKLGDLGAARFSDATLSAGPLSPQYIARERMDGRAANKSKETDVYSMGVTICELFTAVTPSYEDRDEQLQMIEQWAVRGICMKMVLDDPRERPSAYDALRKIDNVRDTFADYKLCPPKRMVKGKIDGEPDVTLVHHM